MSICHSTPSERLEQKLARAERKIQILENLIEDQSRLIYERSEELESAMQESTECRVRERLLTDLIEHANEAIFAIDPMSGLLIETNSTAARVLGYSRVELRQANIQDIELKLETLAAWQAHIEDLKQQENGMMKEGIHQRKDGTSFPVEVQTRYVEHEGRSYVIACARDITQRKRSESKLREAQDALLETSRKAGMADVASSILHNVGNVLNSLIVNAVQLDEQVKESELKTLLKAKKLIDDQGDDLEDFVKTNAKATKLMTLVAKVTQNLEEEQSNLAEGLSSVRGHLEHVRSIISRQQKHARAAGVIEEVQLEDVIEDAIELSCGEFSTLGIRLIRSYFPNKRAHVDRNKMLEILVNLLSNAKHALLASQVSDKIIEVVLESPEPSTAKITIKDNGVGIPIDKLHRIFEQGFTTKPEGNGLGLHASAIAAQQMKGQLQCESRGEQLGASFYLVVPMHQEG